MTVLLALTTACTASSTVHTPEASAQTRPAVTTAPQTYVETPVPLPKVSYSTKSSNILRCQHTSDEVVLSYDDGITNQKKLDSLLGTLDRNNIRAYFFFTGKFADDHPKMMRQIAAAGHVLGNHSYSHPLLTRLSDKAIKSQIKRGVRGNTTRKLLRPPYGGGAFTPRLQKIARGMGYALCFWTVDTRDWDAKASPSAQTIVNRVIKGDKYSPPVKKGGVILMHGTSAFGVKATPAIIKHIKKLGLHFPKLRA
ncbi:polysaccharide deacetylase family protein [Candidatus Saccharibacteria bacterium]|nr:MAG: polysaccharide deacetylase family protein [Candidatus Saccharibacteria bacterium]